MKKKDISCLLFLGAVMITADIKVYLRTGLENAFPVHSTD